MRTWTATTTAAAGPEAVLDVLTDPEAAARWAPLPFDVDDLGGRRVRFDIHALQTTVARVAREATL